VSALLATRSVRRHEEDRNERHPPRTEKASGASEGRTEAREEARPQYLRREGEYWQILYKGQCIRIRSVKVSRGFTLLKVLVSMVTTIIVAGLVQ
jgi:hypothetical protein